MNEIKQYFEQNNIVARQVAIKMGISPYALGKHLSGNPSLEVIRRIADAVGCNISDFFKEEDPNKKYKGDFKCPHCGRRINIKID